MARKKKTTGRKGRKVRVRFRSNRSRPARDRGWTRRFYEQEYERTDPVLRESVVAKGALSRKRTIIEPPEGEPSGARLPGRVVSVRGLVAEVDDGSRLWPCTVRRVLRTRQIDERRPVVVGDRVEITVVEQRGRERSGVIEAVLPRRGCLTRTYGQRTHTVAANVDQAVIVASLDEPPPKPHLIDRCIVAAHAGQITPVICLNKCDLDPPGADGRAGALLEVYEPLGYRCVVCSATAGQGIDAFQDVLRDKASVIVGQSGVGKSSLLNAVEPGLRLRTGEVSADTQKGRHITTTARLLKLSFGGYVVDTPGLRSFQLARVAPEDLEKHFVEIAPLVAGCRFPDCAHVHETGCAVRAAVEAGQIDAARYESYVRMLRDG